MMVDIVHINQIYLMFRSRLQTPKIHPTRESSEVQLVKVEQIPWDELAFTAIEKTLSQYVADRRTGRFPFRSDAIEIHPHTGR
jgi:hypothetical protein